MNPRAQSPATETTETEPARAEPALDTLQLSPDLQQHREEKPSLPPYKTARRELIEKFEREYVAQLVSEAHGNVALAARRAQMDRTYLIKLIRRHGLQR
jgi:transcriptional regulator with GAF, ATPase, and Fis domain